MDVGTHLTGLVPWMFLTDVPQLKHPERKFVPENKLQCRVLRVNVVKKQLHLTSKPFLLNEQFDLVASFEVELNTFFLFFIKFYFLGGCGWKSNDGLLLQLLGDLRGFAPRSRSR